MGFCGGDNDENDYEVGYRDGAAVMFGLLGMALGIQANHDPWFHCPKCGSRSLNSGGKCLGSVCGEATEKGSAAGGSNEGR